MVETRAVTCQDSVGEAKLAGNGETQARAPLPLSAGSARFGDSCWRSWATEGEWNKTRVNLSSCSLILPDCSVPALEYRGLNCLFPKEYFRTIRVRAGLQTGISLWMAMRFGFSGLLVTVRGGASRLASFRARCFNAHVPR
eukprot:1659920-Pleurochrysis_carterae.AAC.1